MTNMYDWIGPSWNPLGGECSHQCNYCYVKKMMFRPSIKAKYSGDVRLHDPAFKGLGKGKFYFVCSMNDLFANDVKNWQIGKVLEHCWKYDNEYLFQTKNPMRYSNYELYFPPKSILATTIESNIDHGQSLAPLPEDRALGLSWSTQKTMVTIEPIMQFDLKVMVRWMEGIAPIQINIGADSGNKNLPEPEPEKIRELIQELKKITTVKLKSNLKRLLPEIK